MNRKLFRNVVVEGAKAGEESRGGSTNKENQQISRHVVGEKRVSDEVRERRVRAGKTAREKEEGEERRE